MNEKELIDIAIRTYCNLQRIKKYEVGENIELEYQIREAKAKLEVYGINTQELDFY